MVRADEHAAIFSAARAVRSCLRRNRKVICASCRPEPSPETAASNPLRISSRRRKRRGTRLPTRSTSTPVRRRGYEIPTLPLRCARHNGRRDRRQLFVRRRSFRIRRRTARHGQLPLFALPAARAAPRTRLEPVHVARSIPLDARRTTREGLRPTRSGTLRRELLHDLRQRRAAPFAERSAASIFRAAARHRSTHSAGYHIFVGSKAPWYDITDDLPQHREAALDHVVFGEPNTRRLPSGAPT